MQLVRRLDQKRVEAEKDGFKFGSLQCRPLLPNYPLDLLCVKSRRPYTASLGVELVAGASIEAPPRSSLLETVATISSVVTMTSIRQWGRAPGWTPLGVVMAAFRENRDQPLWPKELFDIRMKAWFYMNSGGEMGKEINLLYDYTPTWWRTSSIGFPQRFVGYLATWVLFMFTSITNTDQSQENQCVEDFGMWKAIQYRCGFIAIWMCL